MLICCCLCRMDRNLPLLRSLSQYAPRLTVLDLRCGDWNSLSLGIPELHSELRKLRGLKELNLREIPRSFDEYVEAITTVLINSPNMETLHVTVSPYVVMGNDAGPYYESLGYSVYGLLPLICERFAKKRQRSGGSVDGNNNPNMPLLKLRDVTVDQHSMNPFILDLPDSGDPCGHSWSWTGNHQTPLYLGKLTDLQYLERLHVESPHHTGYVRLPNLTPDIAPRLPSLTDYRELLRWFDCIRLPNLTPDIAPRLRSLTVSPPDYREVRRWFDWVVKQNFLEYAHQVSLGCLPQGHNPVTSSPTNSRKPYCSRTSSLIRGDPLLGKK